METIAFSSRINYSKLLDISNSVHRSLVELGNHMELGNISIDAQSSSSATHFLDGKRRDTFISYGRKLWRLIQKNPETFCDYVNTVDPENECELTTSTVRNLENDRAGSSGIIRAIAGRLVLMEKLSTISCTNDGSLSTPTLIRNCKDGLPSATFEEMEFGVKCFSRAGKSILTCGYEYYEATHSSLSLVLRFWEGMKMLVGTKIGTTTSESCLISCSEEVIASQSLLPDLVCLMVSKKDDIECQRENCEEHANKIIIYLKQLEDLLSSQVEQLSSECITKKSNIKGDLIPCKLAMQRHFPILAKSSFKVRVGYIPIIRFLVFV